MAFIHFASCPVWGARDVAARCTCPREWRIRRRWLSVAGGHNRYPWVISHRDDNGAYRPIMYATRFEVAREALLGIMTIIRVADTKHRRPATSGDQVG